MRARLAHFGLASEQGVDPLNIEALLHVSSTNTSPTSTPNNLIDSFNELCRHIVDNLKEFNTSEASGTSAGASDSN